MKAPLSQLSVAATNAYIRPRLSTPSFCNKSRRQKRKGHRKSINRQNLENKRSINHAINSAAIHSIDVSDWRGSFDDTNGAAMQIVTSRGKVLCPRFMSPHYIADPLRSTLQDLLDVLPVVAGKPVKGCYILACWVGQQDHIPTPHYSKHLMGKNITLKSVYETDGFDKWSTCRIHPTLQPLLERLSPLLHYFRLQLKNLIGDAAYRVLEIVENVRFTNLYHPSNPHFCCSVIKFLDNFGIRLLSDQILR
ncbi:hypothetical protein HDU79_008729 [Rhizoclosmatium sp. JEL0117]|nr:hypothetical protein HDU79_008729 [Rhizoclosmatium sp. JEL0117]